MCSSRAIEPGDSAPSACTSPAAIEKESPFKRSGPATAPLICVLPPATSLDPLSNHLESQAIESGGGDEKVGQTTSSSVSRDKEVRNKEVRDKEVRTKEVRDKGTRRNGIVSSMNLPQMTADYLKDWRFSQSFLKVCDAASMAIEKSGLPGRRRKGSSSSFGERRTSSSGVTQCPGTGDMSFGSPQPQAWQMSPDSNLSLNGSGPSSDDAATFISCPLHTKSRGVTVSDGAARTSSSSETHSLDSIGMEYTEPCPDQSAVPIGQRLGPLGNDPDNFVTSMPGSELPGRHETKLRNIISRTAPASPVTVQFCVSGSDSPQIRKPSPRSAIGVEDIPSRTEITPDLYPLSSSEALLGVDRQIQFRLCRNRRRAQTGPALWLSSSSSPSSQLPLPSAGKQRHLQQRWISILRGLFAQLAAQQRKEHGVPESSISRSVFLEYFPLPGILGERLFDLFDKDKSGFVDFSEFFVGLCVIYNGTPEERRRFLFDMYDLDGNGYITKDELTSLLRHIPAALNALKNASLNASESSYRNGNRPAMRSSDVAYQEHNFSQTSDVSHESQITEGSAFYSDDVITYSESDVTAITEQVFRPGQLSRPDLGLSFEEFKTALARTSRLIDVLDLFYHLGMPDLPVPQDTLSPGLLGTSKLSVGLVDLAGNVRRLRHRLTSLKTRTVPSGMALEGAKVGKQDNPAGVPAKGKQSRAYSNLSRSSTSSVSSTLPVSTPGGFTRGGSDKEQQGTDPDSSEKLLLYLQSEPNQSNYYDKRNEEAEENPSMNSLPAAPQSSRGGSRRNSVKNSRSEVSSSFASDPCSAHGTLSASNDASIPGLPDGRSSGGPILTGWLYKVGRKLNLRHCRFYVLRDRFLYYYSSPTSDTPLRAFFLKDVKVAPVCQFSYKPKWFGLQLTFPSAGSSVPIVKRLYAATREERDLWVQELHKAAVTSDFHGNFQLMSPKGNGRFGVVHRAIDRKTSLEVAVKILNKRRPGCGDLWRTEISAMRLLDHPNVVKLLNVYDVPDYLYVVMEWVPGGDLAQFLTRAVARHQDHPCSCQGIQMDITTSVFCERLAKIVAIGAARGLHEIHKRHIIHRDLKPENILLGKENCVVSDVPSEPSLESSLDGSCEAFISAQPRDSSPLCPFTAPIPGQSPTGITRSFDRSKADELPNFGCLCCQHCEFCQFLYSHSIAKIADFGLSKILFPVTVTAESLGTLVYVAPEVITATGYGTPVDMWSLGVVLYQILAQDKLPFDGETEADIGENILLGTYNEEAHAVFSAAPEAPRLLVQRLLQHDAKHRLTAADLLEDPWLKV